MSLPFGVTGRRREYARFLVMFVSLGLLMKLVSGFIHEMGHALFVWVLGGKIIDINVGAAWPFTLSYTKWYMADPSNTQIALIASAGILFDALTSIAGQAVLFLKRKIRPVYAISLFWLSFWGYLSSVVYLVMGAFQPFGDILELIRAVPVSRLWIGSVGAVFLVSSTYTLSIILRSVFSRVLGQAKAQDVVSYFWVLLHLFFVLITIGKYGLPTPPAITGTVLLLMPIWSYFAVRWFLVMVSRLKGPRENKELGRIEPVLPDRSVEGRVRHPRLKLGYVVLFSVALASTLVTAYMIGQYTAAYRLAMETSIRIEVTYFELDEGPVMNLSVEIGNPTHNVLSLSKVEFDVHLNRKFMAHQVLEQIPVIDPQSQIAFDHVLALPLDRMFTVEEALRDWEWEWEISGSGHVETLFGDTLLRFRSASTVEPQAG